VRIVLDTNVLLSGVFTRGLCEAILDICLGGPQHNIVLCEHILREFARHAADKFGIPAADIHRTVAFLKSQVELVEPAKVSLPDFPDPDDLPVLGTALAAGADCLVTGDAELLKLKEFRGIAILSPRSFYDRLV
jgi:uncharacterized protein